MGSDRYITWGEIPEWGPPTAEKLAAVALDFLGSRWRTRTAQKGRCIVVECDDPCTFHLASERPEVGDPFRNPNGTRPTRGFEIYPDDNGRTRITTRIHYCDAFMSALVHRYTEIIASWWNGEIEWPT